MISATLKKLMKTNGVSSDESRVADVIAEEIKPYVDEIKTDNLGNLIAYKKGKSENAKKLMFVAHMDEIGFMVNYIEDNGFVRVSRVGGINYVAAAYEKVVFENGTAGVLVPEGKTEAKDYSPDKFYVDIGAKNRKIAERKVKIGDLCAVRSEITRIGGSIYVGRPLDDRVGCYVLLETAKKAKNNKNDVFYVFSTQEEVGLRGAVAASYNVMPDIGIAVDVTPTGDTVKAPNSVVKLGGGAAIKIKDSSVICDVKLVAKMREIAENNKIKYQNEVLEKGGTDTHSMQLSGCGARVGCISIPTRYIHTQNEMIDGDDVDNAVSLAVACAEMEL